MFSTFSIILASVQTEAELNIFKKNKDGRRLLPSTFCFVHFLEPIRFPAAFLCGVIDQKPSNYWNHLFDVISVALF